MAYDFNGTSNHIEAATPAVTTHPVTLACWFNSDTDAATQALVSVTNAGGQERWILQAAGAVAGDYIRATSSASNVSSFAESLSGYSVNTWHHAAGVFASNSSRRAFIDGIGGTAETTTRLVGTVTNTRIGVTVGGGVRTQYTNGRIAEVGIWNAALTDAEISSLAKGIKPTEISPDNLVFYAPLIRDVADYVGNLTLTTTGAIVADHTRRYG